MGKSSHWGPNLEIKNKTTLWQSFCPHLELIASRLAKRWLSPRSKIARLHTLFSFQNSRGIWRVSFFWPIINRDEENFELWLSFHPSTSLQMARVWWSQIQGSWASCSSQSVSLWSPGLGHVMIDCKIHQPKDPQRQRKGFRINLIIFHLLRYHHWKSFHDPGEQPDPPDAQIPPPASSIPQLSVAFNQASPSRFHSFTSGLVSESWEKKLLIIHLFFRMF